MSVQRPGHSRAGARSTGSARSGSNLPVRPASGCTRTPDGAAAISKSLLLREVTSMIRGVLWTSETRV